LPAFLLACFLSSTEAAGLTDVVTVSTKEEAGEELGRYCDWRGPYKPAYSPGCDNRCQQFTNLNAAKRACARRGSCGGITYEKHRGNRWRWELRRGRSTRRSPYGETTYLKGRCRNGRRPRRARRGRGGKRGGGRGGCNNLNRGRITVRGNNKALCGFCAGSSTLLHFKKRNIKTNNLGNLVPSRGPGGQCIWWTGVGDLGGRSIDLIMTTIGSAYHRANIRYKRWGRSGKWFARRFHGVLKEGGGSAGSMKAGTFKFQYRFIYTGTNSAARIDYLPLTYYDLDGGKEFVRTYDAVAVAVAKPTGMRRYGCQRRGSGYYCYADGARREYPFPRNLDRLSRKEKMASVTFLFRSKSSFQMIYKTTYDHRVFLFRGTGAIMCKKTVARRRRSSVRRTPVRRPSQRRRAPRRTQRRRAPRRTQRRRRAQRRRRSQRRRGAKCGTSVVRPRCHGTGCNYRKTYNHGGCR